MSYYPRFWTYTYSTEFTEDFIESSNRNKGCGVYTGYIYGSWLQSVTHPPSPNAATTTAPIVLDVILTSLHQQVRYQVVVDDYKIFAEL